VTFREIHEPAVLSAFFAATLSNRARSGHQALL
jgi:hypothetical protein